MTRHVFCICAPRHRPSGPPFFLGHNLPLPRVAACVATYVDACARAHITARPAFWRASCARALTRARTGANASAGAFSANPHTQTAPTTNSAEFARARTYMARTHNTHAALRRALLGLWHICLRAPQLPASHSLPVCVWPPPTPPTPHPHPISNHSNLRRSAFAGTLCARGAVFVCVCAVVFDTTPPLPPLLHHRASASSRNTQTGFCPPLFSAAQLARRGASHQKTQWPPPQLSACRHCSGARARCALNSLTHERARACARPLAQPPPKGATAFSHGPARGVCARVVCFFHHAPDAERRRRRRRRRRCRTHQPNRGATKDENLGPKDHDYLFGAAHTRAHCVGGGVAAPWPRPAARTLGDYHTHTQPSERHINLALSIQADTQTDTQTDIQTSSLLQHTHTHIGSRATTAVGRGAARRCRAVPHPPFRLFRQTLQQDSADTQQTQTF